jgi:hypothetical protein
MEVVETDDNLPSMRVNIRITITQHQHECLHNGNYWIAASDWDAFTKSLCSLSCHEMILRDMSNYLSIVINRIKDSFSFTLAFTKKDVSNDRTASITFSSEIDDDTFGAIKAKFLDFPVWW